MCRKVLCSLIPALAAVALQAPGVAAQAEPRRFSPALDRQLVTLHNPVDAATWAAWTWRDGAETDIAVSVRGPHGAWSEPVRFGQGDGVDQGQAALAVDHAGTVYLAYQNGPVGGIYVAARALTLDSWVGPRTVPLARARAAAPSLLVVDSHLILAYRDGQRTALLRLPLLSDLHVLPTNDGPDPVGHEWPDSGGPTEQDRREQREQADAVRKVERSIDGDTNRDPVLELEPHPE